MAGREKGVATLVCPECGKDRPVEEQPDGGTAAKVCTTCFPRATKAEVAEQVQEQREQGTFIPTVDTTKKES